MKKNQIKEIKRILKDNDVRVLFRQVFFKEENNSIYFTNGYVAYRLKVAKEDLEELKANEIQIANYDTQIFDFDKTFDGVEKENSFKYYQVEKDYIENFRKSRNKLYGNTFDGRRKSCFIVNNEYAINLDYIARALIIANVDQLEFKIPNVNNIYREPSYFSNENVTIMILPIKVDFEKNSIVENTQKVFECANLEHLKFYLKSEIKAEYKQEVEKAVKKSKEEKEENTEKVDTKELEKLEKKLKKQNFDNLKSEILGKWLWVTTLNEKARDWLLEQGFKFSSVHLKFYYHIGDYKKFSKKSLSYDRIKELYGNEE